MATNIDKLNTKTENNGTDSSGMLFAKDWNDLVNAVIENQQAVAKSIKGITLNGADFSEIDDRGFLSIKTSSGEYELAVTPEIEPPTVISKDAPCIVKFSINHIDLTQNESMPANFPVTARFYCNDQIVGTIENIYDKNYKGTNVTKVVEFDYSKAVELSTSENGNQLWIELDNGKGYIKNSTIWVTRVINMSLKATITGGVNNSLVFTKDNLQSLSVTVTGNRGYLYATIDGSDFISKFDMPIGAVYNVPVEKFIPFNSHGVHELKVWVTPIGHDDIIIAADPIKYIYGDDTNSTPVIMSTVKNGSSFEEYNKLDVNYIAYYSGNEYINTADVYIQSKTLKDEAGKFKVLFNQSQIIDFVGGAAANSCTFSLFPNNVESIIGESTLNIRLGDFIDTVDIEITRSNVPLEPAEGWQVYLTSSNMSNNSENRKVWECTNREGKTYGVIFDDSIEFLEAGSGWNKDKDDNVAMHLRKGKYFELNYKPFIENPVYNSGNNNGKETGKTISIEFATRNCLKQDAKVISCIDPNNGHGFEIFANKINLISDKKTISCNFKEDERIKLDIVIEGPQTLYSYDTWLGTSGEHFQDSDYEALMIIFIDGVYQRLALIPANTTFLQTTPQNIRFGSDYCELDVYNIRMYDFALDIDRIVKNYAYDTPKFEDKIAIAKRNNIFNNPENNRPNIDIQKLREARPDLPFFYTEMADGDMLPNNKSDWKSMTYSSWLNPNSSNNNDEGNVSWETKYGVFRNQGTSSMNYPWPWRNWDFKLDKYKDESGEEKKGYFEVPTLGGTQIKKWKQYAGMPGGIAKITLKKDYASSEMCNNAICSEIFTDMANGIGSIYPDVLSPTQQANGGSTSNYRLTFKATPCFMFNKLKDNKNGTAGKGIDAMGMMNLIPNKNECEYLGFLSNEWEDGEGNPRAQSWEVSENHIFWDFPIETILAENDPEAEVKDGKLGYWSPKMVQKLEEDGTPMFDENGDPVMEQAVNEKGELVWNYLGNFKNGIDGNYEARYPKDSTIWDDTDFGYVKENTTEISDEEYDKLIYEQIDLINFHNWLVSTNRYCATDKPLSEILDSYEDWNYNETTGEPLYKNDTKEYRLKKFEKEAPQKIIIDQWILYYIWREQFWMFDSGAKNLQLYTMDGEKWGCMVRDADTALGIDNVGVDRFPAHLEDIDYYTESNGEMTFHYGEAANKFSSNEIDGKPVLNGQFGSMWLNIRDAFGDKIAQMYRALASNASKTYFNSSNAIKRFEDHQSHWCESLYNFGMRQYFGGSPFSGQIDAGNGDKKNSRKSWLEKGFYYRNSKYNNLTDYFNFRGLTYKTTDSKSNSINIKTYIPMYIACGGSSSSMLEAANRFRITDPNIGAFIPITTGGLNMPTSKTDKNTYIFGSDNITDLGDLARHVKLDDIVFPVQGMQKLTSFKLGDHTNTYTEITDSNEVKLFSNDLLPSLNCNGLPSLTYLDITRHSHISDFQFDKCTQLEEFYASGTDSITSLNFPQTTTLKTVHIGKGLKSLEMKDLTGIKEFAYDGLAEIKLLSIINCGETLGAKTYDMVKDSLKSLESSYKEGLYEKVCTLYNINWKSATEDVINRLINIGADLRGYIYMPNLSYETKVKLMSAYGDIDNSNNPLHIEYHIVDIENLSMSEDTYIYELGEHQLLFTPKNPNGNNFIKTEWSLVSNDYATINTKTGVIKLNVVGKEEDEPRATATVKVHLTDGRILEASTTIRFYQRSCRLGDYVFNDGTYHDQIIAGKTPIGICFYIDNNDSTNRLMVALNDAVSSKQTWGVAPKKLWDEISGNYPYLPGFDNYYYDTPINNITEPGVIEYDWVYDDEKLDNNGNPIATPVWRINLSDEIYRAGDESTNMFTPFGIDTMYGDLRLVKINSNDSIIDKDKYQIGEYIPIGLHKTLTLINHRNRLLREQNMEIPMSDDNSTEITILTDLLYSYGFNSNSGDPEYLLYYPAVSYCYAYEPIVSNLSDKFKKHNWWLPSSGELIRIFYHIYKTQTDPDSSMAIFKNSINDKKFSHRFDDNYVWTSTEGNDLCAVSASISRGEGRVYGNNNYNAFKGYKNIVRPICRF